MDENRPPQDMLDDENRISYVVFDPDNRFSVETLIAEIPTLSAALHRVKEQAPDLLAMDEGTLKEQIHDKLTLVMNRIRMSFWQEYENAVQLNRRMRLSQVIGGICTDYHWSNRILPDNEKMAWIFCPPANYVVAVKEALQAGMATLRDIVSAKVLDDDGHLIPRAADVVIKAVAMLDMRVKGAIIQRIDQRSLNVNVDGNSSRKTLELPASMEELDALIEQTKAKLHSANTVKQLAAPATTQYFEQNRDLVDIQVEPTCGTGKIYK